MTVFVRLQYPLRSVLLAVFVLSLAWNFVPRAFAQNMPRVSNARILTPVVAQFEKFEIEFDVETSATHLNLPYDDTPPAGLNAGIGVSADALFSQDNWQTTITQPAFFYQPFARKVVQARDHWTPSGAPRWLARFAPRATGEWQVKLRVRDRDGETLFPEQGALSFRVATANGRYDGIRTNPYSRHGFLRVSKTDARYFEFEDGTPFLGVGYNAGSESVAVVAQRYRQWQLNGLQFARVWLSGSGINASQWTPWAFPSQPYNFGLPTTLLDAREHPDGTEFSFRLDSKYPCLFVDFWQGGIPVQPNTAYTLSARVKLQQVAGKANAADAGLVMLREGWIGPSCNNLKTKPLLPPRVGTTDWFTAETTFTTGANQNFADYFYFALQNVESGAAYLDDVKLVARDDPAQVNLLRHGRADSHLNYDAMNAARWDLLVEQAAQHGVFLKIVSDEKNEWIRNVIQKDGTLGKFDNNNFYAANETKVRWLHEAWWRYIIARWGYSTAIHSFELVNEGDPYNGNHYNAANAMARYFDEHDPAQHMVTTSTWHSFPNTEFWSNPRFQAVDYADLHAYITTGWGADAALVPPANLETRPQYRFEGKNSFHITAGKNVRVVIHPRGLTLQEPGEWTIRYWMKQENFQAKCNFGTGSAVRISWQLDNGKQGIVPHNAEGKDFVCSSPSGTFDWREFSSRYDREGRELPMERRLVITDTLPHPLTLAVTSGGGISGDAWIANVELISPSGVRTPVLGEFDNTPFDKDTAWLSAAYSQLWGASSPVGARKPLVRGETGVNSQAFQNGLPALNQDRAGIWLHNFVWGQINSGGMYDLWWWGRNHIEDYEKSGRTGNLYGVFLPYANFMADVPLNNGAYRDAQANTSSPQLRAWGQRDDSNGRVHLWIQNRAHDWQSVIEGKTIAPIDGTVRLENMPRGTYRIEWWDTYRARDAIVKQELLQVDDVLELKLPAPLKTDMAVKVERVQ